MMAMQSSSQLRAILIRMGGVRRDDVILLDSCYFFFFQAEDGIRDDLVTGVQTCALPISPFDEKNTPYASHGYAPLDDRPGHLQYDSRRGAGNTNDLRGKILRIKLRPDGSYEIPEGNLFPKGEPKTRPEIYVMGDRNPYRISVDKKTGYLYWREVGRDANTYSLDTGGPREYDEFNQARKAGFFGWPYFVGNNYAYHIHDYETNVNVPAFDPAHPVNDSRNNTGLRELPPAQPAFIWYPYA